MTNQGLLPVVSAGCCAPLVTAPVSQAEAAGLARAFKALADPVRLRLLSLIGAHAGGRDATQGVCVCELTGAFEVTAPTISHHLKVLREAGLIASERRGTWVYYWIVPAALERLAFLLAPRSAAEIAPRVNDLPPDAVSELPPHAGVARMPGQRPANQTAAGSALAAARLGRRRP
ncbi:MAG TPA: metalloregulator ArsR/SmtB family transcription factor [Streptosporangiaceae bacterium]|nr:metalloregulator ArsR/SmtB family transcription factor [Streptosporangiaceae bacterium]